MSSQEALHAKQHVAHLKLLNTRYPGLDRVQQDITDSYDALLESNSLEFNLAYMASLELMFTPFAIYTVRNVETLFGDSDTRVASFMLWHMVEEFEHRRSAAEIYDDVVGDYRFRIKSFLAVGEPTWWRWGRIACDAGSVAAYLASENSIPHDSLQRGNRDGQPDAWPCSLACSTLAARLRCCGAALGAALIRRWYEDAAAGGHSDHDSLLTRGPRSSRKERFL
mgnify:CR=1 FL=1